VRRSAEISESEVEIYPGEESDIENQDDESKDKAKIRPQSADQIDQGYQPQKDKEKPCHRTTPVSPLPRPIKVVTDL
jgi:hypothetical protein